MAKTLPDPSTLDWGSMSKSEFKRMELEYELADETNTQVRYSKPKQKTVPIADALAVAYAAYRINKNEYIKDVRRFSDEANKTQFPNKDLVRYYWAMKLKSFDSPYIPTDFEMFEPTEEDYASAQEALKWMKRYVMLGLGDLGEFKTDMVNELAKEEVTLGMGRIAYAPEFIARDKKESDLKKTIRIEYRDSKHIEPVGEKVEAVIEILDSRYSSQWESYNYTCVTTDGNLVSFMNKHKHAIGDRKRIKAKVKGHTKNRLFSADETRLNYVKLYKV